MKKLRCAIYTRKSTEEGLDMAFNSLDAQREACEAFVSSQRAEGWVLLPNAYDDGGFSGGSMERPGLKRLLEDVRAGRVDTIVVYKVDRLTRSLSDFAKIVDVLDAANASFVSITQAFNTTTSMGRLTLNVLLSFAQFEREVIAERVRDKVAQSRARGIWMGGTVPLGYDVMNRKLVPNADEVTLVRHIFERYLELGSVRALKAELDQSGTTGKPSRGRDGVVKARPFGKGALYWLLSNPLYIGKAKHKDKLHDGEHDAIVAMPTWKFVQAKLAAQAARKADSFVTDASSLLTGRIRDHHGRLMTPTRTKRGTRMHRYYASVRGTRGHDTSAVDEKPTRVSATVIERAVRDALKQQLSPQAAIACLQEMQADHPHIDPVKLCERAAELVLRLEFGEHDRQREIIDQLDLRVVVSMSGVEASVLDASILRMLIGTGVASLPDDGLRVVLTIQAERIMRPRSTRLVFASPVGDGSQPDPALVELLARGQRMRDRLLRGEADSRKPHVRRLARLGWLAPDIVVAILEGRHPRTMTATSVFVMPGIPNGWKEQRAALGFQNYETSLRRSARGQRGLFASLNL